MLELTDNYRFMLGLRVEFDGRGFLRSFINEAGKNLVYKSWENWFHSWNR